MAILRKRITKKGFTYDVDFTYEGKRIIVSTKTSDFQTAKQILASIQKKIALGTYKLIEVAPLDIPLQDFIEEYLKYAIPYKSGSTIVQEKIYLKKLINILGNTPLRKIDVKALDMWMAQLSNSVNPVTFNIERRSLHSIFNIAKKWGYIEQNPFTGVKKMRTQEKRLFLTEDELARLFEELDKHIVSARDRRHRVMYSQFRTYIEFLLNTGLRRAEALNLQTEHIDFQNHVIFVNKTKDKRMRIVPLNKKALEILHILGDDLFHSLNKNLVTHKFTFIAKCAGLSGFKLHSLRHTFATRLIAHGIDIYTVSKLLGHSDIKTTMVYAKVRLDLLHSAVEKLDVFNRENRVIPVAVKNGLPALRDNKID